MSVEGTPGRAAPDGRPVDRNGFFLSEAQVRDGVDAAGELLVLTKEQMEVFRRRERKWQEMLKDWSKWMPKKRDKVKLRCRKGIPNSLRGWAWRLLCGADRLEAESPGRFEQLVAEAENPEHATGPLAEYLDIIERDLDRTFPHNDRFSSKGGEAQQELRKVLRALAMANKELGYCQGMGMIVGTLLMNMPTEHAFWSMMALQDPGLGYLSGVFDSGLGEIQVCGQVLQSLMATHVPLVHAKFKEEMLDPVLYMVDWFMVCFVKTLPWASVLRVWDMFMFEGMKIIYRVSLAILKLSQPELTKKKNGLGELMMYLKNLPESILVPDVLMPAALSINIKTKEIKAFRALAKAEYDKTHPPKPKTAPKVSPAAAPDSTPVGESKPIAQTSPVDVKPEIPPESPPLAPETSCVAGDRELLSVEAGDDEVSATPASSAHPVPHDLDSDEEDDALPPNPSGTDLDGDSDVDLDDAIGNHGDGGLAATDNFPNHDPLAQVQLIAVRDV